MMRRILLVDDNVDFVASLALILQASGHEVRVTHDGLEALEVATTFQPDFIFLDIGLPGLNGYDVARNLRQLPSTQSSILVAITGWGQAGDKRRAREAGFDHHVVKPVEPTEIHAILTRFHVARRV